VGVFRDELPERIIDLVHRSGVKAAQLHGRETPAQVAQVARTVRWVIKAYPAGHPKVRQARDLATDLVMLDAPNPGSGTMLDWSLVHDVPAGIRLILAGGLDPDNVAEAIERTRPWGVDVSSGVEREPGRKDPIKVKNFIAAARAAAPTPYRGEGESPYDWADDE